MGFTFIAAGPFGISAVLSGGTSRHASLTVSFDCESFNSVEQTFTVVVVGFKVAPADGAGNADENAGRRTQALRDWISHGLISAPICAICG